MTFGVARAGDVEGIALGANEAHQLVGVREVRGRRRALHAVAAKRQDILDAVAVQLFERRANLVLGRVDAGEVGEGQNAVVVQEHVRNLVGARVARAAGTASDGDIVGFEVGKGGDGRLDARKIGGRLRGKDLERPDGLLGFEQIGNEHMRLQRSGYRYNNYIKVKGAMQARQADIDKSGVGLQYCDTFLWTLYSLFQLQILALIPSINRFVVSIMI